MMRHAGELQKNLHNHPFTWNKQTIHFQACKELQKVCQQQLSQLFGPSGARLLWSHTCSPKRCARMPVGSVGLRMPSVVTPSHPPWRLSTPARSCLFISAWLRMLMLIDFIKRQKLEGSNLTSLHISGISPAEHTGVTTRQVWLLL